MFYVIFNKKKWLVLGNCRFWRRRRRPASLLPRVLGLTVVAVQRTLSK